jgi:hypothetical protein
MKLAYDLQYVQHFGFWLDFRILLATALHLVGVPSGWIRAILRFPRKYSVEQGYHRLTRSVAPAIGMNGHCNGHVAASAARAPVAE